jgi:hypothetical protein
MAAIGLAVGFAAGCEHSPGHDLPIIKTTVAPTTVQVTTPNTSEGPLAYHLSGTVTDDLGVPLPNVEVYLDSLVSAKSGSYDHSTTRTNAAGDYTLDFNATPNLLAGSSPKNLTNIVAFANVWDDTGRDHEGDFQYVTSATSSISRNFRLSRFKRITAGDSLAVTIAPGDPVCSNNAQDMHPWPDEWICQRVHVVAPADGNLVVTAAPADAGASPHVVNPEDPFTSGTGSISIAVKAGTEVVFCVELPFGAAAPRSFTVTTSLQNPGS